MSAVIIAIMFVLFISSIFIIGLIPDSAMEVPLINILFTAIIPIMTFLIFMYALIDQAVR